MEYILVMLIIMFSGFVQGASGFAFGLVALGLISLIANIKDASVMLAIAGFTTNLTLLWKLKAYYKSDRMLPIIISTAIGAPFGVLFLLNVNEAIIRPGAWNCFIYCVCSKNHSVFQR
ncbi:MAG: hypothetical protein A2096_15075 [Spirochaetes bacterium GWF1_41_5]|nr:MAG: hypothetical protein A2096_15075 [Spirochaetes bacterium GWF1_41_5]